MTSEQLAQAKPVSYATFRALRPGLWIVLGLVVLTMLALGRYQKVEAQQRVEAAERIIQMSVSPELEPVRQPPAEVDGG